MARRKQWRRWLATAPALVVLCALVLWLTFQHRPTWYRPAFADEATIHRAQAESAGVADDASRQIVERRVFEIRLTDRMVNDWLAALPILWPEARDWLPPQIRDPAVSFDDGELRVGAHAERAGWKVIANAALRAEISSDLSTIAVSLREVRGGSLPLPERSVAALLDRVLNRWRRDGSASGAVWSDILGQMHSAEDLLRGVAIRNSFVWPNGDRPFRINRLDAVDGVLIIGMEPL